MFEHSTVMIHLAQCSGSSLITLTIQYVDLRQYNFSGACPLIWSLLLKSSKLQGAPAKNKLN